MSPIVSITIGALVALQTLPPADALRSAVGRLAAAASNEERFDQLTAMLQARGIPFTVERFTIDRQVRSEPRTEGRNVVASFGSGSERIVVGAHYDAVRLQDGSLSRGAVDNAASSIILVELAAALKAQPTAKQVTFVWFDMEELGLVGSSKYIEAHRGDRIAAMVNMDINGYGDTVIFGSSQGGENVEVRRALLDTCAALDRSCIGFAQMPPGDDRSFVKAGIPSLSLAILPALEAHQLWLLMSGGEASGLAKDTAPAVLKTIHTRDDVVEKIDVAAMARMTEFALNLIRRLAGE
jgi:Zn-dependent M28 family amino/carboxypeptidase